MICHIVQNGGCIFLILCLWISIASSATSKSAYTIQEFCSGNFLRTIEPGDPYELTLRSEGSRSSKNKWYQKTKRKCVKEFKTSDPAAHLEISITNITIPSCSGVIQTIHTCRCNYFEISVLAHKSRYCGDNETGYFASKSDTITIEFHHNFFLQFDVTLKFTAERNSYIISGTPSKHTYNTGTYLETPYFPIPSPPSYRSEYTLQSSDANGHVILLFLDFQISNQSFIEVVGNNGSLPTRYYGSTFRPPAIVSQSNHLELKFESYGKFGMKGFRALSYFVKTIDSLSVPYTDCGGLKDGRVGNMNIKTHERFSLYDCMWRYLNFFNFNNKSEISIVIQLRDISHRSTLEFRYGDDSKSNIIKVINCESEDCSNFNQEITVPASKDIYIRFSGYLDVYSIVNMSYSTFHTKNCSDTEFICDGRCMLMDFRCDGIRQCPSGIDEEECPITVIPEVQVITNPIIERENFHNTVYKKFFIIVLVGSFGLVAVLIAVIFLFRYHRINGDIEQSQTQHIIEEMSGMSQTLYPINLYCNDNPPSYEDFIKSSECYPPLLYTRAMQRYKLKEVCSECTTSFTVSGRPRYHSADSSSYRSLETNSDMFISNLSDASEQSFSNVCRVELLNNSAQKTSNSIRKWYSLDSKLNDLAKEDTCHVFLSIIHPICNHTSSRLTHVQCHTLPPNFKISSKCRDNIAKMEEATVCLPSNSNLHDAKERRCTWSFAPYNSNGSEIFTVVKPRCCSDPCKGVRVHCSLY